MSYEIVRFDTGDQAVDGARRQAALALADAAFLAHADETSQASDGWAPGGSVGDYLGTVVDWSISRGAVCDGRLVGMILLREGSPEETLAAEGEEWTGDLSAFEGLRGVEGLAMVVEPAFRGTGLGRVLRAVPEQSGYDFAYGLALKSLGNAGQWAGAGFGMVAETRTCWMGGRVFAEPEPGPSFGP